MNDARAALAQVIARVTNTWDEPLDEVHDIPQIVNAILASDWLAEQRREAHEQAWEQGYSKGNLDGYFGTDSEYRNPYLKGNDDD